LERRVGEILVEMKACTPQELQAALQTQSIFGGRLGTNLLELGIVDERQLAAALSRAHGLPCISEDVEPEPGALDALTREQVARYGAVPLHAEDRRLKVMVADPRDVETLDLLAFATGKNIEAVIATEARLWAMMRRHYGIDRKLRGLALEDDLAAAPGREEALGRAEDEASRILSHEEALRLVDLMSDPVVLSAVFVRGAASSVGRAVFLKCQGDKAIAWLGAGKLLGGDVRGVEVPLSRGTLFAAAHDLRAPVSAPVEESPATARFYQALSGPPPMNAFVGPVILHYRAVALLYADLGPGGTLREELGKLLELSTAINRRFEDLSPGET
jgi:hypothetical protein